MLGLAWGAIAVVLMISRIQTKEGVFIDGRLIPNVLALALLTFARPRPRGEGRPLARPLARLTPPAAVA